MGIEAKQSSDKSFSNVLRNVDEAAKCLVNRHAKMMATDLRAAKTLKAEAAAVTKAAEKARHTITNDSFTGAADVLFDAVISTVSPGTPSTPDSPTVPIISPTTPTPDIVHTADPQACDDPRARTKDEAVADTAANEMACLPRTFLHSRRHLQSPYRQIRTQTKSRRRLLLTCCVESCSCLTARCSSSLGAPSET